MFGRRTIVTAIKRGYGSCLSRQTLHVTKPNPALNIRCLSSIRGCPVGTIGFFQQQNLKPTRPPVGEMKQISKRFIHHHNENSSIEGSRFSWTLASKLVAAAIGAILGGKAVLDNEGLIRNFQVSCAPEDCVEKKCEDSPCLRKLECQEQLIMKANSDLERALKDTKSKAIEYTEAAIKAYCDAISIMKQYLNQGYCLINADMLEPPQYEESWCCVYNIAKQRCEKVKDAMQKGQCAWELLGRLRGVIEAGKSCKYATCNPLLVTAEESLICAERELLNLKARMECVYSEHKMVAQYQKVLEDFKKDLKSEVDAIVEASGCKIDFPEQETALMIKQAYIRAVRAHKEVAQVMICTGNFPERLAKTCC